MMALGIFGMRTGMLRMEGDLAEYAGRSLLSYVNRKGTLEFKGRSLGHTYKRP